MNQVGCRIIFDQDGEIIHILGEMRGNVLERKEIKKLSSIDLKYGAIDFKKHKIFSVDIETQEPVLEEINTETEEQRRIRELEDTLLLQTDTEIGGIL
ncbi:hypothetical protein [Lysinibacillus sp. ZYM-1]|uniref:hypothetical protein n=1 Tax=Lysinibacillus sp. ZYM-1 TaxID=1681184 RepID=UPI0006CE6438|nr:hypothetical protein [Lysinibacillus sp. ZYM-1]KPN95274.1 hypothetical protein AO843_03590 [Lysinibacillus sp. ZYM-1]